MSTGVGAQSTSDGYRVTLSALTDAASDFTNQAQQLTSIAGKLASAKLPAEAFGDLPVSKGVAEDYNLMTVDKAVRKTKAASQRTTTLATGLTSAANDYRNGDQNVAASYKSLMDGATAAATPTLASATTTSTGGAFAGQVAANRPKVAGALTAEQANQAHLQAQLAQLQAQDKIYPPDDFGRAPNAYQEAQLQQQIQASQQKVALYQDILTNNRQIIAFDPSGNGHIAELIGTIDQNTKNVGVLVPGTYTNMSDFDQYAKDAASFVNANPNSHLAMVAWANGSFPQTLVPAAADPSYAQASAPDLAAFSHQLRDQINQQAGPGNDVQVTYAGHSYGGAIVGLAEQNGLDANRTLYVESAGMGHDVWSPNDLHDTQANVQRYAMTAPGDPISVIQGVQVFGQGHGADPNTFPGVTDLATGNYPNGQPITGLAAHNGVFTTGSDAWKNMYGVFTGGPTTPAPPRPQPLTPDPMFLGP